MNPVVRRLLQPICVAFITGWGLLPTRDAHAQSKVPVEVHLQVPEKEVGCDGVDFFRLNYESGLGARWNEIVNPLTIDVRIEETTPYAFRLWLHVMPAGRPTMKFIEVYGPPTQCSKVVAYAAREAVTLLLPPLPPLPTPAPPTPPSPPAPQSKEEPQLNLAAGAVVYGGVLPGWTGMGAQVSLEVPLSSGALVYTFHAIRPTVWTALADEAPAQAALSTMFIGSFAACAKAPRFRGCGQLNMGWATIEGISLEDPKQGTVPVLSAGPQMFLEFGPLGPLPIQIGANFGVYINIAPVGITADGEKISDPSYVSGAVGITLRSSADLF